MMGGVEQRLGGAGGDRLDSDEVAQAFKTVAVIAVLCWSVAVFTATLLVDRRERDWLGR